MIFNMKQAIISLWVLMSLVATGIAQQDPSISWKSWRTLEEVLDADPKPVFVFFHADWCAYCKKMKRKVLSNPEIVAAINKDYYAVTMDVESTDSIFFDNQWFVNSQSELQRKGVHELPLLLASRDGIPFSLPATLILESDFSVRNRIFEYITSKELLVLLK